MLVGGLEINRWSTASNFAFSTWISVGMVEIVYAGLAKRRDFMPEITITARDLDRLAASMLVLAQCVNRLAVAQGAEMTDGVMTDMETMIKDLGFFKSHTQP